MSIGIYNEIKSNMKTISRRRMTEQRDIIAWIFDLNATNALRDNNYRGPIVTVRFDRSKGVVNVVGISWSRIKVLGSLAEGLSLGVARITL